MNERPIRRVIFGEPIEAKASSPLAPGTEPNNTNLAVAEAFNDFTSALELDSQLAEAYANRGLAQLLKGYDGEAEADFARCLLLTPALRPQLGQKIEWAKARRAARH